MRPDRLFVLVLAVPALTGHGRAAAEGAPLLSLDDAIGIALDANHRLGAAEAEAAAADADRQEASAGLLPRIDLIENFSWTTQPSRVFANKLNQENFTADDFDVARLNSPSPLTNWNTVLAISQPLWSGGQLAARSEAAQHVAEAQQRQLERTRQEVVAEVIEAYSTAVLASSRVGVAREALAVAEANSRLVDDLRGAGLVVESDLLQARVRETERRELLVRSEGDAAVALVVLNLALGRPADEPLALPSSIEPDTRAEADVSLLVAEALEARPDLEAAASRIDAAQQDRRAARGRRFDVALTGLAEANDESFIGAEGTNASLLVSGRFTVFDGKRTRSAVRAADQRRQAAERRRDLLRQEVELQVHRAYHDLRAARARLEQASLAAAMAKASLGIVSDRYTEGLTTLVELLDAEAALTGANVREVSARRDLLVSGARLDLALGRP